MTAPDIIPRSRHSQAVRSPYLPLALSPLLDSRHISGALLTATGRIVRAAPAFAEIMGVDVRDLQGHNVFDFFANINSPTLRRVLSDSTNIVVERQGKSYCLAVEKLARGTAVPGSFVGFLYPLGESNRFQQRLLHRDRLATLGEQAAIAAHEIAGPLAVIMNNAEMLTSAGLDSDAIRSLNLIKEQSQRAISLVRGLAEVTRESPSDMKPLDMVATVEKAAHLLRFQKLTKSLRVRFEVEIGIPKVQADATQLQQLFTNLLKNAWDASENQQEIVIYIRSARLRNNRRSVEVSIVDSGCGMDPENLKRVFDPFFSTKPCGDGTGLGLTVARRIVTAHNGDIRLMSSPGNGTRVSVTLPVARTRQAFKEKLTRRTCKQRRAVERGSLRPHGKRINSHS